jgi:hypothetical protein
MAQGVEDAEDVHAVLDGPVAELVDDVIGVVAVADGVLAAEQHLGRRLLEPLLDFAETLPRVLFQEAEAGIEGGAAPAFDGVVADGVHELEDGDHVLGAHAGREERLVAIADGRFHDADFGHVFVPRGECEEALALPLLRVPTGRSCGDCGGSGRARMR